GFLRHSLSPPRARIGYVSAHVLSDVVSPETFVSAPCPCELPRGPLNAPSDPEWCRSSPGRSLCPDLCGRCVRRQEKWFPSPRTGRGRCRHALCCRISRPQSSRPVLPWGERRALRRVRHACCSVPGISKHSCDTGHACRGLHCSDGAHLASSE